jgi:hypothetical protein
MICPKCQSRNISDLILSEPTIMYITHLCEGSDSRPSLIKHPTWEQIKNAIFSLNGHTRSTVLLEKEYDEEGQKNDIKEFMSIAGGGKNQLYVCDFYSYEGEYGNRNYEGEHGELVLFDPSKPWNLEIEIMREFPTNFPVAQCLKIEPILVAAETYSRFGRRDESLHWAYICVGKNSRLEIVEVK